MKRLLFDLLARAYLRKPDLAEFLAQRLPDARSVSLAARNELAFRTGLPPVLTSLNVELTSRCNVACGYCRVNRGLGRPNADIDPELVVGLFEQVPTLRTFLPFQWGEPLLYEPLDEVLRAAARRGLATYLTTNGTLLDGKRFLRLARSGLTRLTVSLDGSEDSHRARRGYAQAPVLDRLAEARAAQQAEACGTRLDVSMVVDESVAAELEAFRARLGPLCDRVQFIPRLRRAPRTTACREPSRGQMVVLSDGRLTACCADDGGQLDLGHVLDAPLPETYAGERWVALRRAHLSGRLPDPCRSCGECRVPGVSPRFQ